jgi:hypothetical protein
MAECIRQTENWSVYEPYHKLDNASFDAKRLQEELDVVAPKMKKMIDTIDELDSQDLKKYNKLYKHIIFSDLKSAGGAKSIGSALLSNGFKLVYNKSLEITKPSGKTDHNFAILCSTKIYNKDVGVRFRRKILDMYNKRPDNIHGEELRFIVLDYGFKEGIDLFDVKYIHIMETPITMADQKQIIGRGTRFCGQKGLHFDKEAGWPLHVYVYKSLMPQSVDDVDGKQKTMFDIFMEYSNIDLVKEVFAKDLEKKCIQASIDFTLNRTIHTYGMDKESFFVELAEEVDTKYTPEVLQAQIPKEVVEVYGKKLEKYGLFNCNTGCKGNVLLIPVELMLIVWYTHTPKTYINDYILQKFPRGAMCIAMIDNKPFCKKLQEVWKNPDQYIIQNESRLIARIHKLDYEHDLVNKQKKEMLDYIQFVCDKSGMSPVSPSKIMNYGEMQNFIKTYYKKLKWPEVVMENLCIDKKNEANDDLTKILFTPSQKMLQAFCTPSSPYKGLLVWHSTGTGKTCSGVSIATNSFDKEGYTILWVTRSTLRGDIWKNMFKQICSITIQEKGEKFDVEDALKHPLKYTSKNWIEPITYKQFSNLLLGKNEYYKEMVKRNGEEDPLRKTFIVIDEAHKLLSHDLKPQEKPDFNVLSKKILDSYDISKKDSVKLLLMTATPYSEDPMQMIQLLNLMRPRNDQFPTNYEEFKRDYLNPSGKIAESLKFMSKVSGYISYLNRETDVRQFAHPIIKSIPVPISLSNKTDSLKKLEYLQFSSEFATRTIDANILAKKMSKDRLKQEKDVLKEKCKTVKGKEKEDCLKEIKELDERFKKQVFEEYDYTISANEEKVKKLKKEIQAINKTLQNYRETDKSQQRIIEEKCLKQVKPVKSK